MISHTRAPMKEITREGWGLYPAVAGCWRKLCSFLRFCSLSVSSFQWSIALAMIQMMHSIQISAMKFFKSLKMLWFRTKATYIVHKRLSFMPLMLILYYWEITFAENITEDVLTYCINEDNSSALNQIKITRVHMQVATKKYWRILVWQLQW